MTIRGAVGGGVADPSRSLPDPRANDWLPRLQRVTASLVAATTSEEVAQALTTALSSSAGETAAGPAVSWCQIWLARDDELVLTAASAEAPPPTVPAVELAGTSALAQIARGQVAVFATGAPRDASCPPGESLDPAFSISAGLMPIVLRDTCLGVAVVAYPPERPVDPDERDFLVAVASQLAQALERARLYADQQALAQANAFLAKSAQIVAEASGFAETLERLSALALDVLGDICLIDVLDEDGFVQRMVGRHRDRKLQSLVDRLSSEYPPDPSGHHPALDVLRTGRSSWAAEMDDEFLRFTTRDVIHFQLVKALGFRSYLTVPLLTAGEVLGTLTLVSAGRPFDAADVSYAERLALQVAAVVNNARRFDASQETSHILQQSLLPRRLPAVDGLEVETRYLPATRGLEVGGDFYDLVILPSRRVGFMIGDVAGHDRDAAAAMGQLRSAARALAGQVREPAALIGALQWSWDLLGFERMATAIFGRLDQNSGDLILASAGHHPPLLISPDGPARYLPVPPSTPLGAPAVEATDWEGHLAPGQVLLLYTDGVLDGWDGGLASGGMDRLAAVAGDGEATPAAVCTRVIGMLPQHRTDDVALLAFRIVP